MVKPKKILNLITLLGLCQSAFGYYCPKTKKEWTEWRDSNLRNLSSPRDLGSENFQLIEKCIKDQDQKKLLSDPQLSSCLAPIRAAASAMRYGQQTISGSLAGKSIEVTSQIQILQFSLSKNIDGRKDFLFQRC